jgi:DNA-binding MarR family transcriptional regulator
MPTLNKNLTEILDDTDACACLNLRGAARAVTQYYDELLKPSGLKITQFSVLAAVATKGPASMTAISKALVMDRTTLTRNLKPLMDRGLVQENKNKSDRRQRQISLTREGLTALSKALPLWKQAQNQLVNGLGYARWQGMLRLLDDAINLTK